MGRLPNWCFYCGKRKIKDRFDLQQFLVRRLPIFWIMGPSGCGKDTLSGMLEKSSKYTLVKIIDLIREEMGKGKTRAKIIEECLKTNRDIPDEIIITLIKEYIFLNFTNSKGFIFTGFPYSLRQAKLFESEICKVNIIIYCVLILDSLLGRMITKFGDINTEKARLDYVMMYNNCQKVYKYFQNKTLKVMVNYPPEDTAMKLISDLEDYWGYKFDRLYNKNL